MFVITADEAQTLFLELHSYCSEFYGCPLVASIKGVDFVLRAFTTASEWTRQLARDWIEVQHGQEIPDDSIVSWQLTQAGYAYPIQRQQEKLVFDDHVKIQMEIVRYVGKYSKSAALALLMTADALYSQE